MLSKLSFALICHAADYPRCDIIGILGYLRRPQVVLFVHDRMSIQRSQRKISEDAHFTAS